MLKINLKSQLKNWKSFFWFFIVFISIMIYLYFRDGYNIGFIAFYMFLTINFSFTLYLHIAYYLKNKNEVYIIKKDRIEKTYKDKKEVFYSSDIKKIVICKSANVDGWGITYITFESFRIARVYLNDETNFIMTNLLEYDLEKPLSIIENVKFERRKGFSFFI